MWKGKIKILSGAVDVADPVDLLKPATYFQVALKRNRKLLIYTFKLTIQIVLII